FENSEALLNEILQFRLSHHFIPSTFPLISWIVTGILSIIAITTFKGNLRRFGLIIVAGCILYFVLYENLGWVKVTYSQWYKTTIWLEYLGIVALFRQIEKPFQDNKFIRKFGIIVPVMI